MTRFYKLNPECPGGLGGDTAIVDRDAAVWQLQSFQLVLEQWPEDDLMEAMLAGSAVTEPLADALRSSSLTGFELGEMEVLEGDQLFLWKEQHPEGLPKLFWLKVKGVAGRDDFGLSGATTVVSENALEILKHFRLENCDIEEYKPVEHK